MAANAVDEQLSELASIECKKMLQSTVVACLSFSVMLTYLLGNVIG